MMIRRPSLMLAAASIGSGCATGSRARMHAELPDLRTNCGLSGTDLERDRRDSRLLHLVFRSNLALQARRDGRAACARLWAEEQGYRLTTEPGPGGVD